MTKRWLQVALAIALLGLLLWRARVWELGDTFGRFTIAPVLAAALLSLPAIAILAFRTHLVLRRLGYEASPLSLLPVSALGNIAAIVTPGATGDLIRTPFLKGQHAVSYTDGLAAIV